MGRKAQPTESRFGQFIRDHREDLPLPKAELATRLGVSVGFVESLESGRRGLDLDALPRLADALQVSRRELAQVYLAERHPKLYRVLFGDLQPPQAGREQPEVYVEDVHWRLDQLPRRERGIVEATIYAFYDLTFDPVSGREKRSIVVPSGKVNLGPPIVSSHVPEGLGREQTGSDLTLGSANRQEKRSFILPMGKVHLGPPGASSQVPVDPDED